MGSIGDGAEEAVGDGLAVAGAGVDVVGALELLVLGHVVAVGALPVAGHGGGDVAADRVAGGGDVEGEAVDVDAELAAARGVGVVDLDAVAEVGADDERLDGVVAEAEGDLAARLLLADGGDLLGEDVHLAVGIVVAEAVQGDVDVDGGDGEALDGGVGRARLAGAGERAGLLGALHGEDEGRRRDGEDERVAGDAPAGGPPLGGARPLQDADGAHRDGRDQEAGREGEGAVAQHVHDERQLVAAVVRGEEHRVDRVADAEDIGGREGAGGRGEAALEAGLRRGGEAPHGAAHEPEGDGDGEQHERQGERRVAQPVHEEAGLVALHPALAGVEELQPGAAPVGEGDGQRRGAGQVAVEGPPGAGVPGLGHGGGIGEAGAGHLVAVLGGGLVGGAGLADAGLQVDDDRAASARGLVTASLVAGGIGELERSRAPVRGMTKPRLASTAASGCRIPSRTLALVTG